MKFYHTYPKLKIKGESKFEGQNILSKNLIPKDLKGKTVLDLGAWDGYYSFVAAERGADVVVAIDNLEAEKRVLDGDERSIYKKYNYINKKKKTNVHFIPLDVMNIDKIKMNFDVIICFGLFYHVENPYMLFKKCYEKCNKLLLIEGLSHEVESPVAFFLKKDELNNDPTNYWLMTSECIKKILYRIGFKSLDIVYSGWRCLIKAYK